MVTAAVSEVAVGEAEAVSLVPGEVIGSDVASSGEVGVGVALASSTLLAARR